MELPWADKPTSVHFRTAQNRTLFKTRQDSGLLFTLSIDNNATVPIGNRQCFEQAFNVHQRRCWWWRWSRSTISCCHWLCDTSAIYDTQLYTLHYKWHQFSNYIIMTIFHPFNLWLHLLISTFVQSCKASTLLIAEQKITHHRKHCDRLTVIISTIKISVKVTNKLHQKLFMLNLNLMRVNQLKKFQNICW